MENRLGDMIINWDQTPMKLVPSASWAMEKRGTQRVEISATDDKWLSLRAQSQVTSYQYKFTTPRCLTLRVPFHSD